MSPAKTVKARIEGPRDGNGNGRDRKTRNVTVAGDPPAIEGLVFAQARFVVSVHDAPELPAPGAPEVAFAGRSNAGKSSAINALAGRRRLAFVSKTPGRTQLINFFALGSGAFLVDLPGYGYAGVPGEVRRHWERLVGDYIASRPSLTAVVVVMDVRHPLTPLDRQLIGWLESAGRAVHVLLTKADKLSRQQSQRTLESVRKQLASLCPAATVQLFSSVKRQGVEEASAAIAHLALHKNKAPAKGE